MKRKLMWLVVSGLAVLSLVLASCAPKVTEEEKVAPKPEVVTPEKVTTPEKAVVTETKANVVEWQGTKRDGTVVKKMVEKPRYGGTVVTARFDPPIGFDEVATNKQNEGANRLTNEVLFLADWTRGPLGTGEWTRGMPYYVSDGPIREFMTNVLGTSWEIPEPDKLIFHIRPGVHFALDPSSEASRLVNGRELTANDIVYNYRRNWTVGYLKRSYPHLRNMKNPAESVYVSPTDKWSVIIEAEPRGGSAVFRVATDFQAHMPPEVIEKYGNMNDWRNVVGTGPYLLKDYVSGSSLTWVKNPNYWGHDVFFPENQLPYLDNFKLLIIPDLSTRLSALRTGKIDYLTGLLWEDADSLQKTNPELKWTKKLGTSANTLFLRNDVKPFDDINVRRALNMAVDNEAIGRDFYGGQAEVFTFPTSSDFPSHVPLAQMPESVKELYGYYPEKAKQLLAEAGYPNGFQTNIVTRAVDVDRLSIVKGYWEKIGVDLKIDVKDIGVWNSMGNGKTYTQIYMGTAHVTAPSTFMVRERPGKERASNFAQLMEQWVDDYYYNIMDNFFDPAKTLQLYQEYNRKAAERAWYVALPVPYEYNFWQPRLKNFEGFPDLGKFAAYTTAAYMWIDPELKKKGR